MTLEELINLAKKQINNTETYYMVDVKYPGDSKPRTCSGALYTLESAEEKLGAFRDYYSNYPDLGVEEVRLVKVTIEVIKSEFISHRTPCEF